MVAGYDGDNIDGKPMSIHLHKLLADTYTDKSFGVIAIPEDEVTSELYYFTCKNDSCLQF